MKKFWLYFSLGGLALFGLTLWLLLKAEDQTSLDLFLSQTYPALIDKIPNKKEITSSLESHQ